MANIRNSASRHTLERSGLRLIEQFDYKGETHDWFEITKEEWKGNYSKCIFSH
ncbi:hypothetical protein [Pedobacter sp. L105]|uniref:hypothetical protein n=1 Tax=Pedobacter sp. L105 TaxID=1641871 RepID=UPI00131D5445|nr:hypothetical protein [Pedobacter sp. L105]